MKRIGILLVVFMLLLGMLVLGDVSYSYVSEYGPAIVNWGNNVKYGGTLRIINPGGPLQPTWNPFGLNLSPTNFIYETLFYINSNGDLTYLLATSYRWINNNLSLVITVREGVKWSDGQPFTPEDVAFSFNYLKEHPSIDLNGIWAPSNDLESVSATENEVLFKFSRPNLSIFELIASEPIIPEHIWSTIDDPSKFLDQNPIGTGPFILQSFDQTTNTVTYVKNSNYWMPGRPYVDKVIFTSVNSNNSCVLELLKHNSDMANLFIPDVQNTYLSKDPSNNKIWWPVLGNNYLLLNDAKYPFNIPEFRKALSLAINRKQIIDFLYSGNILDYDNPTLITYPQRSWLDPVLTSLASSEITYNPQKAQEMLESIGFKKNAQGFLTDPEGKVLPSYTISVVSGWTDWIQGANILAQEFKAIGLNVEVRQESFGLWYSSLQMGTFDMSIRWTTSGPTPYYAYYYALASNQTAPIGQAAFSNFSRYTNPIIDSALEIFNSTNNPRLQEQAIYVIERIMLDDLPVIAFLPTPTWDVYQTSTLTGFPDSNYPYGYSLNTEAVFPIIALNVHLK